LRGLGILRLLRHAIDQQVGPPHLNVIQCVLIVVASDRSILADILIHRGLDVGEVSGRRVRVPFRGDTIEQYALFPGPVIEEEPAGHFAITVAAIFSPGVAGGSAVCARASATKPSEKIIAAAGKRIILRFSITGFAVQHTPPSWTATGTPSPLPKSQDLVFK